jgi:cell division transport system permease protein
VKQASAGAELKSLPAEAFPSSLEVGLRDGVSSARLSEVAERVKRLAAVEEVETYGEWFSGLSAILRAAQWGAGLLALLVAICVVAVIGNTIRLAVANRRDEIEVLKLCGATDGFVRSPFVVEGALQGFAASLSAMVILLIAYAVFHGLVAPTYTVITGVSPSFLYPLTALAIVVGGGAVGALGSLLSLRRYLVA